MVSWGVYKSTAWFSSLKRETLAITQYAGVVNHNNVLIIDHADIILNASNPSINFGDVQAEGSSVFDLSSVILHEMGHFIGIDHLNTQASAIMRSTILRGENKRAIFTPDYEALVDIYGLDGNGLGQQVMALTGGDDDQTNPLLEVGRRVTGQAELNSTGECRHYLEGKLTHIHYTSALQK